MSQETGFGDHFGQRDAACELLPDYFQPELVNVVDFRLEHGWWWLPENSDYFRLASAQERLQAVGSLVVSSFPDLVKAVFVASYGQLPELQGQGGMLHQLHDVSEELRWDVLVNHINSTHAKSYLHELVEDVLVQGLCLEQNREEVQALLERIARVAGLVAHDARGCEALLVSGSLKVLYDWTPVLEHWARLVSGGELKELYMLPGHFASVDEAAGWADRLLVSKKGANLNLRPTEESCSRVEDDMLTLIWRGEAGGGSFFIALLAPERVSNVAWYSALGRPDRQLGIEALLTDPKCVSHRADERA